MTEPVEATSWMHINDASEHDVRLYLPDADIVIDGDCGSVWGEHHEDVACPHPHVLVRNPTEEHKKRLQIVAVGYLITGADWEDVLEDYRWIEDDKCLERELHVTDYRVPYVRRVP